MANLKEYYDRWHTQIYQTDLKKIDALTWRYYHWILKILKVQKDKKVLDVSCGKGLFLKVARTRGLRVYGIDLAETAIQQARKIVQGEFICGNAEKLPYPDRFFDYVTCLGSLEHFKHPERGVQEMCRVLKDQGRGCIYVPNLFFIGHIYFGWRYGLDPTEGEQDFSEHFRGLQGWLKLIEANGFKIVQTYKYNEVATSQRVHPFLKAIFHYLIKPILPLNLSYSFAFLCQKNQNFYLRKGSPHQNVAVQKLF